MTSDKEHSKKEHIMFRARDAETIRKFTELKRYFKELYGVTTYAQTFRILVVKQHNLLFYDDSEDDR